MCGIAGAIWSEPALALQADTLERMTDQLRHRGPDDSGSLIGDYHLRPGYGAVPGVALGHRRLSIIDLACGRQPLTNEDGSVAITFNGEIYNFKDLRRRLEGNGHRFRTASDTETIVHLYEDEGLDFVQHLGGMFAFALWDANRGRLVLARDRLGKKPLVYRQELGRLLFASELKSLLAVPGVPREIDPGAIDQYLTYQYVPHPHTIFQGIHKLPPAHYAVYENDQLRIERYWNPDFNSEVDRPPADYADELRELLRAAVRTRLQSDVPVGAFLSGGIDSSLVTSLMRREFSGTLKTFSVGFSVAEYDETRFAQEVSRAVGTEHHELRLGATCLDVLPKLIWHFDEPFGDSSALPTYHLAKLAREHVTVALTGDGGDELFAGYDRYQAVRLAAWLDRLPSGVRRVFAGDFWRRLGNRGPQASITRRLGRFAAALALAPSRRYLQWTSTFDEPRRGELYAREFVDRLPASDPGAFLEAAFRNSASRGSVTQASLADLVTYLPCDLLTKVDVASMAHGLECRQPLLDHRIVELAICMPERYKLSGTKGKCILREGFKDLLPASVLKRRKMGFGAPLAPWFRNEWRESSRDVLLDPQTLTRGYFNPRVVWQLFDEHRSGQFDHSYRLWSLLVLELWHREWVDA